MDPLRPAPFLLWQLADSGFPAGGFAHSAGLEAAVQHGHVDDGESLYLFARHAISQAGSSALPIVAAVHDDPSRLAELDELSDVFLTNPIANQASRAQGRTLLTSTMRSFPQAPIAAIAVDVDRDRLAAHHAPIFGAVLKTLGCDVRDTQRLFLFLAGRGIGSAAVRLGVVGGYAAQELQTLLSAEIDEVIDRCGGRDPLDVAQTAPLVDLLQATHHRLYSRLFQS